MSDVRKLKEKLWKKMSEGPFVMIGLTDSHEHSEPLTVQLDKDQVDGLFFFVGKDNRVAKGGAAMAQFVSKGQDFFACLSGTITTVNDRSLVDKLWSKPVESWFPAGKDDPNLQLIRFEIADAELWESDLSLGGKLKLLFGGKIDADEAGHHARVSTTAV